MAAFLRKIFTIVLILDSLFLISAKADNIRFRGAWIATVANIDWPSPEAVGYPATQQQEMIAILDRLQALGINAVIFQVRPTADALYWSELEPWSHWLTGVQGFWQDNGGILAGIDEQYDPLEFVTAEAHDRNMEVHAWLNPYRVTISSMDTSMLVPNHVMRMHPDWFWQYGEQWYFEPGLDETRQWICHVVEDIVSRYDIDAIHMDDYFYPYPKPRQPLPDKACFEANPRGFTDIRDWRRNNVNMAIRDISRTIRRTNPNVEFGISPFGVWRNNTRDSLGSATTAGLTNYDNLYADVLYWIREGWIDYVCPQLYWHIGNRAADFYTLAHWWAQSVDRANLDYAKKVFRRLTSDEMAPPASKDDIIHPSPIPAKFCKLYIGMAPYRLGSEKEAAAWRTGNEIDRQMKINRSIPLIEGECFYSVKPLLRNPLGVCDTLRHYYLP